MPPPVEAWSPNHWVIRVVPLLGSCMKSALRTTRGAVATIHSPEGKARRPAEMPLPLGTSPGHAFPQTHQGGLSHR